MKKVQQKSAERTKSNTAKAPAAPLRPRLTYEHSGTFEGESVTDAMRRHLAWIMLALEQLDQTGEVVQAERDIEYCAKALLRLSLEVSELEELEARAKKAVA